ncbi:MAG: PHP domain-containing protein [Ignavibacteriales bacterium]
MSPDSRADLHIHTTASDGTITPGGVVEYATRMGLAAIAITDHDTSAGVAEAMAVAERQGIDVIPGLEINTDVGDREMHILGYLAWPLTPRLAGILELMRSAREVRIDEMVRRLEKCGIAISAARVREIAGGGVVGRPHVARAMVEAGKVRSIEEAFHLYLDIGRPCYVERYKISPQEAVGEIALAGGVPVLAHPGSARRDDLIPDLIAAGLRGIEAYHPDHDAGTAERYLGLCKKEGLIPTGGSDSHGEDDRGPTIGRITVAYEIVAELRAAKP